MLDPHHGSGTKIVIPALTKVFPEKALPKWDGKVITTPDFCKQPQPRDSETPQAFIYRPKRPWDGVVPESIRKRPWLIKQPNTIRDNYIIFERIDE